VHVFYGWFSARDLMRVRQLWQRGAQLPRNVARRQEADSAARAQLRVPLFQKVQIGRIKFRRCDQIIDLRNGQTAVFQHDQSLFAQGLE